MSSELAAQGVPPGPRMPPLAQGLAYLRPARPEPEKAVRRAIIYPRAKGALVVLEERDMAPAPSIAVEAA